MTTWKFTYWYEGSDWFEWETEISDEEAVIINDAIEKGILLDEVDALSGVKERVYAEIEEAVQEDYSFLEDEEIEDMCEGLTVHFYDPNEPFYYLN